MKRPHPLLLSVLGGGLLWASWPVSPFTFLIFIAFVPFFRMEQQIKGNRRFFGAVFSGMLIWNACCTWWVCLASLPGGIVAMLFSSTVMSLPWLYFRLVKKRAGEKWGYTAFIAGWLSFEYIYLNIQLSWPWLTLGNVFATHPNWVQWYEVTGSSGGTLWILLVNLFIFLLTKRRLSDVSIKDIPSIPAFRAAFILLIIPIACSYFMLQNGDRSARNTDKPAENNRSATNINKSDTNNQLAIDTSKSGTNSQPAMNVVVVQPNIDPYQKFDASTQKHQLEQLIRLSDAAVDSHTRLLVWPETALSGVNGFNEERLSGYRSLDPLWDFLNAHPHITLYTGIETYRIYPSALKTASAHRIPDTESYFDAFNSATLLNAGLISPFLYEQPSQEQSLHNQSMQERSTPPLVFYHKSKLVPGVEMLPTYLRFLDKWFEAFGGTSGGYAGQEDRTVLEDPLSGYKIAPAICYESVYGEFLTAYIRNGANVIGIITNDGWWGNTPGYRQHNQYARLRAIETRRWIIRSANTGISCFIDPYGRPYDQQPWETSAAIKREVPMETRLSFFVRHGDLISKTALAAAGILMLFIICWPGKRKGGPKKVAGENAASKAA